MTEVRRYRPRQEIELWALQLVWGVTTKREIVQFCPGANVGVLVPAGHVNADKGGLTDLRWVMIPTHDGMVHAIDGDYIVKGVSGEYFLRRPDHFAAAYEEIDD